MILFILLIDITSLYIFIVKHHNKIDNRHKNKYYILKRYEIRGLQERSYDEKENYGYNTWYSDAFKSYQIIDLQGKYILPGLINMHVHLAGNGKPQKKQKEMRRSK